MLKVTIKQITLTSQQAVMVTAPQLGVIGDELSAPKVTMVPIEQGHAVMPGNMRVPLNPMVGVIGVAPAGKAISCGTPDSHGGNMDCKMITAGSTLWLPVNVPGALFALGDLHAAMGDGEVSVCDLQICQVVDPLKTCRYALPKSVAAQLSLSIEGEQA